MAVSEPKHRNNFGVLRLFFATLVIVSHSPEIIDGNRSREFLTGIFGTLSFGELAVDGFFVISGYLVLQSFENSRSVRSYVGKRISRIYPGFLVAFFICCFTIAPFVGTDFSVLSVKEILRLFFNALILNGPNLPAFVGLPVPTLNGAMWSISVEFRCYLFVLLFALIGLYKNKWMLLLITAALLSLTAAHFRPVISYTATITGDTFLLTRCLGVFCVGSCYYAFREILPFNGKLAGAAVVALIALLFSKLSSEAAFAILGGYLIFWTALHLKSVMLERINSRNDISYGVYLYAWPVQSLLVYFLHIHSPWLLTTVTTPIVFLIGSLSWTMVERRFVRRLKGDGEPKKWTFGRFSGAG